MDDQRTERRTHLAYYLRIFERGTRSLFGHVVDVSPHGLLITSDKPMHTLIRYHLALEDVSIPDPQATLDLEAECRWCQEDSPARLYNAGFHLITPSNRINRLFATYQ